MLGAHYPRETVVTIANLGFDPSGSLVASLNLIVLLIYIICSGLEKEESPTVAGFPHWGFQDKFQSHMYDFLIVYEL